MTAHGPMPVPARITLALDYAGLHGPQVDVDLGGAEPMVDDWESGKYLPTPEQVQRLAAMTGRPVAYFYQPVKDWERYPHRVFLCDRTRRGDNGLTVIESYIGWDGVIHIEELTPPRPPYRPRTTTTEAPMPRQDTPRFVRRKSARPGHLYQTDPDAPGTCAVCHLIRANRAHIDALPPTDPAVAQLEARRYREDT